MKKNVEKAEKVKKTKTAKNSTKENNKNNTKKIESQNIVLENLKIIAHEMATHFGDKCEICIHDLSTEDMEHTIVYIENGHITHRRIGDSSSNAYLRSKTKIEKGMDVENKLCYTSRTKDGKFLKSSTVFLKDANGHYKYMMCINQDMSDILSVKNTLDNMLSKEERPTDDTIASNVGDLLETLVDKSIALIGKAPADMNKEEKKAAIGFLNEQGAFLITGAGDMVSECFGISKFTLYTYLNDNKKNKKE